jgi:hypothetical protein
MMKQNKLKMLRQRRRKFFWLFMAAAMSALLYTEEAAALYLLSTLAISGLLLVVAFSNLEGRDAEMQKAARQLGAAEMIANPNDLRRRKRGSRVATGVGAEMITT